MHNVSFAVIHLQCCQSSLDNGLSGLRWRGVNPRWLLANARGDTKFSNHYADSLYSIDMHVEVPPVSQTELLASVGVEASAPVRAPKA